MPKPHAITALSRLLHGLRHPWWTLFFAAILAVCTLRVLSKPSLPIVKRSTIGDLLRPKIAPPPSIMPSRSGWFLRNDQDDWTLLATPDDSADAVAKATVENPSRVASLTIVSITTARGFFEPAVLVQRTYFRAIRADGVPMDWDAKFALFRAGLNVRQFDIPEDLRARLSSADWIDDNGDNVTVESSIVWPAVANNIVAALACAGLAASLFWIPTTLRQRRRARRMARGLCPFCAYDRRSTAAEAPCPECGNPAKVTP